MNKFTKISSIVAAVLLLTGTIFKLSHWPGANIILTVGAAAGAMIFILIAANTPASIKTSFAKVSFVVGSLTIIFALLAFVFKLLHWPGAGILIWIADIGILLSAVVFLIDGYLEKDPVRGGLKTLIAFFALMIFLVVMMIK